MTVRKRWTITMMTNIELAMTQTSAALDRLTEAINNKEV